jgi:multiple sugar transport system substrate-binding protein
MAYTDIVPAYREQVIAYGGERMALPLGGSVLVLVYRREAMERRDNLAAAEQAGIALEVPETWDKLDALARFFHDRDWDGDGEAEAGLAFALGPDDEGVGTDILVARAAALGQHRDHFSFLYNAETMEPRIASPPFVTALEALVALKEAGPPELPRFDAEAARSAFRSGAAALLIDRAERAADWIDPDAPQLVGVAPLPGSTRVFEPDRRQWEEGLPSPNRPSYLPRGGGWLVGVVSASASRAAALDFAAYLASSETSGRIFGSRDLPMIPVRSSLLGRGLPDPTRAKGVDGRRWSEAIQKTLLADRVVVGLRVPGGVADHRDLEAARVAAVGGEPAESALRSAERQWAERTDAYGRDRRRWHYRRGLNSLSTAPEPPPRGGAETR